MALEVNIHEAKTQLSKLLNRVMAGEEVIIAKAGRPVAVLSPIRPGKKKRQGGMYQGQFTVPDDFDAPLPQDALDEFYK